MQIATTYHFFAFLVIKIICDDVNSGSQPLMAFERSSQGARRNPAIVTKYVSEFENISLSTRGIGNLSAKPYFNFGCGLQKYCYIAIFTLPSCWTALIFWKACLFHCLTFAIVIT